MSCIACEIVRAKILTRILYSHGYTFEKIVEGLNKRYGSYYYVRVEHKPNANVWAIARAGSLPPYLSHIIYEKEVSIDEPSN
jgi:hypothetical protein